MHRLYQSHAYPLARIVDGLPTLWDQNVASVKFPSTIINTVWSPCNKFIAVALGTFTKTKAIEIVGTVTLERLSIFPLDTPCGNRCLIFSPDTHLLTFIGGKPDMIITWDVQTGVLVSTISPEQLGYSGFGIKATYSTCGTMIGVCNPGTRTPTISTYNVLSGKHIYSHPVEGPRLVGVWTHGEFLQFAVLTSGNITIWEIGFTSTNTLAEVESLPLPDKFPTGQLSYYPALSRLVSTDNRVCIWDTQFSKYLLNFSDTHVITGSLSSSSSGYFFVCGMADSGVYLWKESSPGYILHQSIPTAGSSVIPDISPSGELVLTHTRGSSAAQLWNITESGTPSPTISTQASQNRSHLVVFSPDEALAAITHMESKTVTVLDLKSGTPRLIIDTGIEVYGLGVVEGTVVVVGYDPDGGDTKIVTWNLPGDFVLNSKANIDDSVETTNFYDPPGTKSPPTPPASLSPDLCHFVMLEMNDHGLDSGVHLYDVLTGQCLTSAYGHFGWNSWFTRDGCGVWCADEVQADHGWKIIKDGESGTTRLEHLELTKCPPGELPWQCPPGYEVNGGWVLNSSGKQLLWLPPHWWPGQWDRVWGKQFLALLDSGLPGALIVEFK